MESVKKSSLYKQVQLRNKVDKMNKAEIWALERKLRVIKKETDHFNAMFIRKKRDITLRLKEIQKNSGHSIMSLQSSRNEKCIRESPLFKTGIILSEKQFKTWRIKEKAIQERYRIKELEQLQELNRQKALIQLLKDLNIISSKVEAYTEENETEDTPIKEESDSHVKRFPLIFKKIHQKNKSFPDIPRPITVDCSGIRREYIDTTTKVILPSEAGLTKSELLNYEEEQINLLKLTKRVKSATVVRDTIFPCLTLDQAQKPKTQKLEIKSNSSNKKYSKPKPKSRTITPKSQEKKIPEDKRDEFLPIGFAQMPRWKRQLLLEAPVGLNNSFSNRKIHIIMSQAQKRRDLEELITNNVADIETLAKEKTEEQRRKVENIQATLREMSQLEQEEKVEDLTDE